jgi:hypothetical protein
LGEMLPFHFSEQGRATAPPCHAPASLSFSHEAIGKARLLCSPAFENPFQSITIDPPPPPPLAFSFFSSSFSFSRHPFNRPSSRPEKERLRLSSFFFFSFLPILFLPSSPQEMIEPDQPGLRRGERDMVRAPPRAKKRRHPLPTFPFFFSFLSFFLFFFLFFFFFLSFFFLLGDAARDGWGRAGARHLCGAL